MRKPGRPLQSCSHTISTCVCGRLAEAVPIKGSVFLIRRDNKLSIEGALPSPIDATLPLLATSMTGTTKAAPARRKAKSTRKTLKGTRLKKENLSRMETLLITRQEPASSHESESRHPLHTHVDTNLVARKVEMVLPPISTLFKSVRMHPSEDWSGGSITSPESCCGHPWSAPRSTTSLASLNASDLTSLRRYTSRRPDRGAAIPTNIGLDL